MFKAFLLLAALLCLSSSFVISVQKKTPKSVPWPFTRCGDGDWHIDSMTLSETPKRGITAVIDVVLISSFSSALPLRPPPSPQSSSP